MWSYAVVLLWFSEAWSQSPGPFQTTTEITTTPLPAYDDIRNASFNQGRDVTLMCSSKTWNETLFVTWKISLEYTKKDCQISFAPTRKSEDTCQDEKSLRNTSSSQSYLHIPNFSREDVGVYKCQSSYRGGSVTVLFDVSLTVPPEVKLSFKPEGNRTVAVCRAERGNPAANISWSPAWNSSSVQTLHSPGLYTTESRLVLPEGEDTKNLSCFIRHPCWEKERKLPEHKPEGKTLWLQILSVVILTLSLAALVFIAQKKLRTLRPRQPPVVPSSKSPPREEVEEEVEPYASYVQRCETENYEVVKRDMRRRKKASMGGGAR